MRAASGWVLLGFLLTHASAHVAIAAALARTHSWPRAVLALVFAPLAPVFAWRAGMRTHAYVWLGALGAYALLALFTY